MCCIELQMKTFYYFQETFNKEVTDKLSTSLRFTVRSQLTNNFFMDLWAGRHNTHRVIHDPYS